MSSSRNRTRNDDQNSDFVPAMVRLEIDSIINNGVPRVKNNNKSEELRKKGNNSFGLKKYDLAYEEYTKSLYLAESGSLEQKFTYGNRSALLYQKGYYAECIQDIDRALKDDRGRYPKNKQEKLFDRKKRAKDLLPQQKAKSFYGQFEQIKDKNPVIPSASPNIKISANKKSGQFIEATEDIKWGETLLIEQPYAFCLSKVYLLQHCSECGELCFNMISCDNCFALYCGPKCKTKAFDLYHKYECIVQRYYIVNHQIFEGQRFVPLIYLPLRSTIRALKNMKEKRHEKNTNQFHSDCYEELKQLEINPELFMSTQPIPCRFQSTEMAKITYLLTLYTNIEQEFNIDNVGLRKFLIHNCHITNLRNADVFRDIKIDESYDIMSKTLSHSKDTIEDDPSSLGNGLYAVLSRFKHSCCPNVTHQFYGSTVVARAQRSIKKGEQCFISYIPPFSCLNRKDRRQMLKLFGVNYCDCKACTENWPTVDVTLHPGKQVHFEFHPRTKWPFNGNLYRAVCNIYSKISSGPIKPEEYKSLWQEVLKIYDKLNDKEPSPTFEVLDNILKMLIPHPNAHVKF